MSLIEGSRKEREELLALLMEKERRIERKRQEGVGGLICFVRYFWHVLEPNRRFFEGEALYAICEHLEAIANGDINRLLMNVSPGFMKSLLSNVFFPAWLWSAGDRPSTRFVTFSYAAHLTERDNGRFRDLIRSPEYQDLWGHRVQLTEDGKVRVANAATGWKFASSVRGVGTGERGDIVIFDDPHNVKESESEPVREETVRWFEEGMQNRLNDLEAGAIIVIMQRVHEADVSGVILDRHPEYVHLCIPMEYEADRHCETAIGWRDWRSEDGELAWPERFPAEQLEPFKRLPFLWAGQYQQRPEPRGGGILKRDWWQVWDEDSAAFHGVNSGAFPPMELIVASLDPAYTEKEENDPSALTIWGLWRDRQENPQLMLMNAWAKRLEIHGPEIAARRSSESDAAYLERQKQGWGLVEWVIHTCARFKVDKLLIESKASGLSVFQEIRRLQKLSDWATTLVNPGKEDKVARAYAVQPHFANGQVWAPDRSWSDMVISQCASFPKAAHDDLVDCTTQCLRWFRENGLLKRPSEIAAEQAMKMTHKSRVRPIYDI